jgi:hypoxanthine phosphoribosyltransferase
MSSHPQARVESLFDSHSLSASVLELGRRVGMELGDEDPVVIAVLGESVIFFADLVRAIRRPVRFEMIHVEYSQSAAGEAPARTPVLDIHYPMPIEIAGQTVVLVKDVVESGIIESYLDQQLRDRGARAVKLVALIDMPAERKISLEVDYHAFQTSRQGVLVGYGLKHGGRYGNLPFIGRLLEP